MIKKSLLNKEYCHYLELIFILYKQKLNLPMDPCLSEDVACPFLEFLKSGPFRFIILKDSRYFCYIDDTLYIHIMS